MAQAGEGGWGLGKGAVAFLKEKVNRRSNFGERALTPVVIERLSRSGVCDTRRRIAT
jgi:hypothetical protein